MLLMIEVCVRGGIYTVFIDLSKLIMNTWKIMKK